MQDMPPSTIHKYVMHYGLTPAANTTNTVYGNVALLAPLTFQQAVMPCPPPSSLYTHPRLLAAEQTALLLQTSISSDDLPKQDPLTDLVEGTCEDLKTPAIDGQEPTEADGRLVDLVTQHWDKVQVKEGETIVNFMYAIRMKSEHLFHPRLMLSNTTPYLPSL